MAVIPKDIPFPDKDDLRSFVMNHKTNWENWRKVRFHYPYFNVKDYGAIGDGVTDDTAKIQNAIDAAPDGSTLFFPAGTYKLTAKLNITSRNNIRLLGEGSITILQGYRLGNTTNDPGGNQNYGFILLDDCTYIRIEGIKFDGQGSWTATPFSHPYGGGNAVGFTTEDAGLRIDGTCSHIEIADCYFFNLQYGIYFVASDTCTWVSCTGCHFENLGTGNYFQKINQVQILGNRVNGVYGNCTNAGTTSTAESKYADGFYLYNCKNFLVSDNHIQDIIRIGIVIEGDAVTLSERGVIANNQIDNLHDHKGTELNAGIWIESTKSDTPIDVVGNTISNSEQIGIQAYWCNITGGTIKLCETAGIRGSDFHVSGVTFLENKYGIDASNGTETEWSITVTGCRFIENTHGGVTFEQSKGYHEVSGCYFKDNGLGTAHANVYGFGVRIVRYYNTSKHVIVGNTFVSTEDTSSGTGQLWGILGQAGGDYSYDVKYISGNTFLFTGTVTAYPTGMDSAPVAFAYTTGSAVTTYDIMGWNGNVNSKMAQPELDGTSSSGYPRWLGFATAAPSSGTFRTGDYYLRKNFAADQGWMFVCTSGGSPGTWEEWGYGSTKRTGNWIIKAGVLAVEGTNLIQSYGVGTYGGTNTESLDWFHNGASGGVVRMNKAGTGSYRDLYFQNNGQTVLTLSANGSVSYTQGADVASASTISTGYGNLFKVTGTTTISLMSKTNIKNGTVHILLFESALTLKHNQAASAPGVPLLLSGSVDWSVTAGSTITVYYDSSADCWRETARCAR